MVNNGRSLDYWSIYTHCYKIEEDIKTWFYDNLSNKKMIAKNCNLKRECRVRIEIDTPLLAYYFSGCEVAVFRDIQLI